MKWKYSDIKFEYEKSLDDFGYPWSGHKYFAYDLVRNIKPKKIVELGTFKGTSFFSFCQAVKDSDIDCEINAVDIWEGDEHSGFYGDDVYDSVCEIRDKYYGDIETNLIRKTFDDAVSGFDDSSIDILHIDGLHTYEAVKHDYETWISKVKDDGIVLFHDIVVTKDDFGVYRFWDELVEKYDHLEFMHSYGLGVVFRKKNQISSMQKKELERHYSFFLKNIEKNAIFSLQNQVVHTQNQIHDIKKELFDVYSSKMWKMGNFYRSAFLELQKMFFGSRDVNSKLQNNIFENSFLVNEKAPEDKVEIILIRFNNKEIEDRAISLIKTHTQHPYKLTIYDNYEKNEGLSTVWNRLIKESKCKYICLINSDAFVCDSWLTGMMRGFAYNPDVVAISPSSNDAKGQICEKKDIRDNTFKEMDTLSGFCLLIKKDVPFKFPEEIPFYGGEHAWCIEAKRHGKKMLWSQGVWIEHLGGASAKKEGNEDDLQNKRNQQFFQWIAKTTPVLFTTYNRLDYTKKSLPALLQSNCGKVIVFDNCSTDGTRDYLKSLNNPKLTIILNERNVGISGAMNAFFDLTKNEEFVAKVDNDTLVPTNWLVKMVSLVTTHNIDAIQAKHFILSDKYESFDLWMSDLQKIGEHVFLSEHIGGSGIVIKRDKIKESIKNSKWVLGGWDQYQKTHPHLKVAFCDNVQIDLLDMECDNKFDYGEYSAYYEKTGRKKDLKKEMKKMQYLVQKKDDELSLIKSSKFWKLRTKWLGFKKIFKS